MGKPKAKLTPAHAFGSERNASPAVTIARTTSFFIIKETRKLYPRIQENKRGKSLFSKAIVFSFQICTGNGSADLDCFPDRILPHSHMATQGIARYSPQK
jgi:hypothetical protein